jgi:hypothetical protein
VPKKSGLFFAHRFDSPERVIQTRLPLSPRSAAPAHTAPAHNASMIAVKGHMLRFATKVPSARQRSEKRRHGTRRKVSIAPGKTRSRVRHSKSDARGAFCHSLWREPVKRLADDASRVTFEGIPKGEFRNETGSRKGATGISKDARREKLKIDFRFFGFSNGNQTPQTAWMPSQTPATVERR